MKFLKLNKQVFVTTIQTLFNMRNGFRIKLYFIWFKIKKIMEVVYRLELYYRFKSIRRTLSQFVKIHHIFDWPDEHWNYFFVVATMKAWQSTSNPYSNYLTWINKYYRSINLNGQEPGGTRPRD